MPKVDLLPITVDPDLLPSYTAENFRMITDALGTLLDYRVGTIAVTGSLTVVSGLTKVLYVLASFAGNPPTNDCITAVGSLSGTPGSVSLKVYGWGTPALVVSTTAINVTWLALGFP